LKSTYSKAGTPPLFIKTRNAFSISNPQGEIILNEQMYTDPNIQRWTLSNGIDMWYLRDSQANDDVGIYYTSLGGKDALSPNLYPAIEVTIPAISRSGVGDFNGTEFDAYLTSQDIQVHPFIDFTRHGIQLKVKKDVLKETFATLNAVVTSVKVSPEQLEAVKQEFIQDRKSYLESSIGQFSQAMNQNTYKLESSHFLIDGSSVESVSVEDVRNVHQQLFGQLRNNQLIIVGNIDPRELKPLVRKYVASIPLKKGVVPEFKVAYKQPSKERVELAINNVNTTEYILRTIAEKVSRQTAKDVFMEDLLQRILNTRLNSYIREELSLDYSPDSYSVSQDGESSYDWFITASVAPENIDKIEVAIDKVITGLLQGISENELRIAAKQLEADFTPLDVNPVDQAWFVSRYLMYNYGVEALFDIEAMANSISSEDMNELAKRIFGNKSRKIKNIMSPQALVY
jgi:zinc protease